MPEGDTIYQAARRLHAALAGDMVRRIAGSAQDAGRHGGRLVGRRIASVRSLGKHLIIDLDGGWALRTHLGRHGAWRLYRRGEPWGRDPGPARVVVETDHHEAVCFSASRVQISRAHIVADCLAHLGPDLLAATFDEEEALRRARASPAASAADLLLDQTVMAGVGNVFKSEILYLEAIHPESNPARLDDEALIRLVRRARRLLVANRASGRRTTTGRGRGDLWVYRSRGRPCRRCGEVVQEGWVGSPGRITYWCDGCQRLPR